MIEERYEPSAQPDALPDPPLPRQLLLNLARNVARERQRAGLTQRQLADLAELSRATVHLIEGGLGDPRLSTVARLAEALELKFQELLTEPR